MTLTGGELFAGIGGFGIAMKRAGIRPVYAVEIDERCQDVLRLHDPELQVFGDVRSVGAGNLPRVDLIAGGFPCQAVSLAGKRKAQEDHRWLWPEYARIIRELRPRYVLLENVNPGLRSPIRVLDADKKLLGYRPAPIEEVLGDLAAIGYDTEWDCIPASAAGAPHQRDRIWIVAYPHADGGGFPQHEERDGWPTQRPIEGSRGDDALGLRDDVADAASDGRDTRGPRDAAQVSGGREPDRSGLSSLDVEDADSSAVLAWGRWRRAAQASDARDWWRTEPGMGRVAHGIPHRVDRLTELGNALVPQVAEIFTRCIAEHAAMSAEQ